MAGAHMLGPLASNWLVVQSIIDGESSIDTPQLQLKSVSAAEAFISCYGFDWNASADRDAMERIRCDAIDFIREELLVEAGDPHVPDAVHAQSDVRQLLMWASKPPHRARQTWACAVLRVMHTLVHTDSDLDALFGDDAREQILSRFEAHVVSTESGMCLGRGPEAIELAGFEVKRRKTRRSTAMKLLQKPEHVAADIFDRIGLRFITNDRLDALRVAHYLCRHHIVMAAHIKPRRSRNSLIDLVQLHASIEGGQLPEGTHPSAQLGPLRKRVDQLPYPPLTPSDDNPFSSRAYHALQFTCRQRIRVHHDGELIDFFFPYEVQIMDEHSYETSRSGMASHNEYKRRQRETVRRRVLGGLIDEAT